jgi:hypothetical protein
MIHLTSDRILLRLNRHNKLSSIMRVYSKDLEEISELWSVFICL